MMLKATSSKEAPWRVVHSNDKRKARLNAISHILECIPHKRISHEPVKLPPRSDKGRYNDQLKGAKFVAERY
jgi:polyphosphate kinase